MSKTDLERITFKGLSLDWLEYKKATIKESSYLNYKFTINTKFIDEFGNKSILYLLSYNFNTFVTKLMENHSSKTVKDIITILKSILKYAEIKYDVNFKVSLIYVSNPSTNEV